MVEKVKFLIEHNKLAKEEIWSMLNDLSNINDSKMSKDDREALLISKSELQREYDMRGVFIGELNSLLQNMEKIKTIHENKVLINPPILENNQPTMVEVLNNLENYILSLQRYYNSVEHGCPIMEEYEYGEYIKLEDVLTLFSAKK